MNPDVIIIGAGAAGLLCAIECGKRGRRVLVLENSHRIGNKIRISGGGRCNYTNRTSTAKNFVSSNPHFCKSALARFTPGDFQKLVDHYRIKVFEKKLGQMFCKNGSLDIINLLQSECDQAKVKFKFKCSVTSITKNGVYHVHTNYGNFESESVVIATGGLSIPKMGATDFGYKVATKFGISVVPCRPALVPLVWDNQDLKLYKECSGISIDTEVTYLKQSFRENILLTHQGLSGPAILQMSLYWVPGEPISINLVPNRDVLAELISNRKKNIEIKTFLSGYFPKRFAKIWSENHFKQKSLNQCSDKEFSELTESLNHWNVTMTKNEGYNKAEVTAGGIDTNELSSKTMESLKVPKLYFIGEVVDVTGHLGGHNFQWAWASGYVAGQYA